MKIFVGFELVIDIGDDRGRVAGGLERLRERHVLGKELMPSADFHLVVGLQNHLRGEDSPPRIDRAPARYRRQYLGISIGKHRRTRGQSVHVRRSHVLRAVAAEPVRAPRIHADMNQIQFAGLAGRGLGSGQRRGTRGAGKQSASRESAHKFL